REHRPERSVRVEDLDPAVRAIADIHVVVAVDGDRMRQPELAGPGARSAPRLHPVAVAVVLRDARVDVAVADVDVALRIPRDVGGLAEQSVDGWQRRAPVLPRRG